MEVHRLIPCRLEEGSLELKPLFCPFIGVFMEPFPRSGLKREMPPHALHVLGQIPIKAQELPLIRLKNLSYDREL